MTRCASTITLAATMGLAAGLTAFTTLVLMGSGQAEPLAPKPALVPVTQVSVLATPATVVDREGRYVVQQAALQDGPARVARVVYPSHYSTQR